MKKFIQVTANIVLAGATGLLLFTLISGLVNPVPDNQVIDEAGKLLVSTAALVVFLPISWAIDDKVEKASS